MNNQVYADALAGIDRENDDPEAIEKAELKALILAKLGRPLGFATFNALYASQSRFRHFQREVVSRLERGEISPHLYLAMLNEALNDMTASQRSVLGGAIFLALYGEVGLSPTSIIDQDAFYASEARRLA